MVPVYPCRHSRRWCRREVWAAVSDGRDGGDDVFITESTDRSAIDLQPSPFDLSIGSLGRLTDASATGQVSNGDRSVEWTLEYEPDSYTFTPVDDEEQMVAMARSQDSGVHWSANESVAMTGTIMVDGEPIHLEDAPGHQGHTARAIGSRILGLVALQ
ncbi:MAG: hypothetical protein U5K37_11005 [Natrialbaceae archaeon]|nr:hypothetical protein [Natrialbaceae archaeon]